MALSPAAQDRGFSLRLASSRDRKGDCPTLYDVSSDRLQSTERAERVGICSLNAAVKKGDFVAASLAAEQLVALRGEAEDWCEYGWSLLRMGRRPEALDCFEEAIEQDDAHIVAWVAKGVVLNWLRRNDDALVAFD